MKTRTLFAACAASITLAACSMPPYNEKLSLAQVTMSKLGAAVTEIGPVYANLDPSAQENKFYFLPDRDDPVGSGGFLVAMASYGLRVWYLADYSTTLEASWAIDLQNSNETTNNYLLQPIESATAGSYYLSLTRYLQNDMRLVYFTGPASVAQYPTSAPISLTSALLLAYTVGANIYPDSADGSDRQFFLGTDGIAVFQELAYTTSSTTGFVAGNTSLSGDYGLLPDGLTSAFYSHDPITKKSYLSYWSSSSGAYLSYSWTWDDATPSVTPSNFQQLTGVQGRIEAVLTTGQLLAFGDGACTVYSDAGKKLYDFPLGDLKFCYERWDPVDGRFELYFSLAYWLFGREERSDQLYVKVYSIPTSSLSSLK